MAGRQQSDRIEVYHAHALQDCDVGCHRMQAKGQPLSAIGKRSAAQLFAHMNLPVTEMLTKLKVGKVQRSHLQSLSKFGDGILLQPGLLAPQFCQLLRQLHLCRTASRHRPCIPCKRLLPTTDLSHGKSKQGSDRLLVECRVRVEMSLPSVGPTHHGTCAGHKAQTARMAVCQNDSSCRRDASRACDLAVEALTTTALHAIASDR